MDDDALRFSKKKLIFSVIWGGLYLKPRGSPGGEAST